MSGAAVSARCYWAWACSLAWRLTPTRRGGEIPFLAVVPDQTYTMGTAITDLILPEAAGGTGTLTYALTPDVPGLTFDANTRTLSGTPTTAATTTLTYTVTDTNGATGSETFDVTVAAANNAPVFAVVSALDAGSSEKTRGTGGATDLRLGFNENTTEVVTLRATDVDDTTASLRYELANQGDGNARDRALFSLGAETGVLAFISAPDLETPASDTNDNVYVVFVRVKDDDDAGQTRKVIVVVRDIVNEVAGVTLSPTTLAVDEGLTATYTVVLDSEPSADVTLTPTGDDDTSVTVSSPLTFTTTNWQTAQTITVTSVVDDDEVDETVTIGHTVTGGDYASVTVADVSVIVTDTTVPAATDATLSGLTLSDGTLSPNFASGENHIHRQCHQRCGEHHGHAHAQ